MSNTVTTTSQCGRCGKVYEQVGAQGTTPPVSWASMRLVRRHEGAGYTNSDVLFSDILCPECQAIILGALGPEVRDDA